MRGKRWNEYGIPNKIRITPADAGKTLIRSNTFIWAKDHPRGCGEN